MKKLIIIGSGPAGLTAAIYSARARIETVIVEGLLPGGQLTTTTDVENYPGFPASIDGYSLVLEMRKQAERFGTVFVSGDVKFASLVEKPPSLTLETGEVLQAAAIIIATGASARYLGIASEQKLRGKGVSACATCDGALYRDVPLAVVGGGDTAMEEALFLTRFASRVTIIHRRDQFRASKIMAERVQSHPKISIVWNSAVEEVLGAAADKVTGVRVRNLITSALSDIPVGGLFLAIGHKPNTDAFKGQLDMDETGYLIAKNTRTNIAGVFAAGDVQDSVYRQAITAAGSGCMAALEAQRYLESLVQ
ncbi:MAG: thioredoxin-disulfide reductase [bacterium]